MDAPTDLLEALAAAPLSQAAWEGLTPIGRRDFLSWIESAKQAETRRRRIERAVENLAAGKRRPCCYAVVPLDLYRALDANADAKACWATLTPDEKRDISNWIESTVGKEERKSKTAQACALLAEGKAAVMLLADQPPHP